MTTTSPTPSNAMTADRMALERLHRVIGVAGVAAVLGFAAFMAVSAAAGGVDPLTSSRAALSHSLTERSGSGLALWVLGVSALSYVPLLVFFAGLRELAGRMDSSGLAKSVTAVASALFVSGAVAGDGFNLGVSVAQHLVPSFQPTPSLAVAVSAGWLVCLVEAQVALGVVCATVGIAILTSRQSSPRVLPGWLGWWGVIGAVSLVPMLCAPNQLLVFAGSNLVRLLWIFAVGVTLLRRRGVRRGTA